MILHGPEDKRDAPQSAARQLKTQQLRRTGTRVAKPHPEISILHTSSDLDAISADSFTPRPESEAIGACVRVSGSGKGSSECAVALGKALAARYDEYRDRQFGTFASGGERALTSADALCRRRRG